MVSTVTPSGSTAGTAAVPPTRFAQARGARIAYQDFGSGPTVVAVPPMAQNVEVAWERPELRSMFERFGSFSRWVQFDKRGTGASDRRTRIPGLDERVDDLRAVMDHAEVDRAFLYGASEGGPMCLLFAATYPDRVDGLVLHGSSAYLADPDDTGEARAKRIAALKHMADVWGTEDSILADVFSPTLAKDQEYRTWLQRYERLSADQDSLRDLLAMMAEFDVRDVLAQIKVPTLVLHRTGDLVVPVEYGREVAAAIDGAKMVEQEGIDHFAFVGDMGWLDDLERFVTGTVQDRPARSVVKPKVAISTLGRFVVDVDGVEVPTSAWGSRLARVLCKRLVVARGWPVTREELFELLWPGETDMSKLGSRLSVQLSAVRRVLGGAVIADRHTVALNLEEVSTDLERFHQAEGDEDIVAAYGGEFLPEDRNEDWSAPARDEAKTRFTGAARRVAEQAAADDRPTLAIELAHRLIEADRYDEDGHRLLVRTLNQSGETAAARRAHAGWRTAMAELDVPVVPFDQI